MHLALHRRTLSRLRRVLMLAIAPLLLAGLVVLPGSAPAALAANAGVDISAGEKTVELIKPLVRATFRPEVVSDIGGFGGLFAIDWKRERFEELRPGILGATRQLPQLTVTLYRYAPGSSWEQHSHPQDQVTIVLEGEIEFTLAGVPMRLAPGAVAALPGGVEHSARVAERPVVTLNVYTRREHAPPLDGRAL